MRLWLGLSNQKSSCFRLRQSSPCNRPPKHTQVRSGYAPRPFLGFVRIIAITACATKAVAT